MKNKTNIWQMKNKNSIGHNRSLLNTLPQKLIILVIAIALLTGLVAAADITAKEGGDLYVDGDLGVGTSSPGFTLDVQSSAAANTLMNLEATGSTYSLMKFTDTAGSTDIGTTGNGFIINSPSGTRALTIDSSSNVGIGTSSPKERLVVIGNVSASEKFLVNSTNGGIKQVDNQWLYLISNGGATIELDDDNDGTNVFKIRNGANAVKFYVEEGGNVGIGTDVPGQKLDVRGNINTSGNLYYDGSLIPYSPHVFGVDSDVGFTRACWYDAEGYWNLVWYKGGIQQVETDSAVCNEKIEKIEAKQECYDSDQLFDKNDMSCYDYPEEEEQHTA